MQLARSVLDSIVYYAQSNFCFIFINAFKVCDSDQKEVLLLIKYI